MENEIKQSAFYKYELQPALRSAIVEIWRTATIPEKEEMLKLGEPAFSKILWNLFAADFDPKLVDADELAEWLGCTKSKVLDMLQDRTIPFLRINKELRFHPGHVYACLESAENGMELIVTKAGRLK